MDKQELLKLVYEEIDFSEGELKEDKIVWRNIFGAEHFVSKYNIAFQNDRLAWYENNDAGLDVVKLKLNKNFTLEWKVPVNSMGFSYGGCRFIQFCNNFLIAVYADKHTNFLAIINIKTFELEKLAVKDYSSVNLNGNVLTVISKNDEHPNLTVEFHDEGYLIHKS